MATACSRAASTTPPTSSQRSGFTYGWDARGRMTSRSPSVGFGTSFIRNSLGQMTRSTVQGFPSSIQNYEYDGRGRMVAIRTGSATTDQFFPDRETSKFFVYGDQTEPVAWVRGSEQQFYVYGSQRHVPDLIYVNNTGDAAIDAVYRVLTDERGSVRLVINVSGGAGVQRIEYDPWGVPTYSVGFGVQPYGYAGAIWLQAGLWHMGARKYDPVLGRWLSRDPIGFGGGMNLYEYAGNDPVDYVDVTGRIPAVGGLIGGSINAANTWAAGGDALDVVGAFATGGVASFLATGAALGTLLGTASPTMAGGVGGGTGGFLNELFNQGMASMRHGAEMNPDRICVAAGAGAAIGAVTGWALPTGPTATVGRLENVPIPGAALTMEVFSSSLSNFPLGGYDLYRGVAPGSRFTVDP